MLQWLKKANYIRVRAEARALNSLAAAAPGQKRACTRCGATDLPPLAMLGLTLKDAVLQEGSLPAL